MEVAVQSPESWAPLIYTPDVTVPNFISEKLLIKHTWDTNTEATSQSFMQSVF